MLQQALDSMATSPDKKLWVEMALLKLSDAKLEDSSQALLQRLDALERQVAQLAQTGVTAAPEEAPPSPAPEPVSEKPAPKAPEVSPEKEREATLSPPAEQAVQAQLPVDPLLEEPPAAPPEFAPPPEDSGEIPPPPSQAETPKPEPAAKAQPKLLESWGQVLEEISKINPPLFGVLSGSIAHDVGGGRLVVDSPYEMFSAMIKKENYLSSLQKALFQVTGNKYRILTKKKKKAAPQENRLEQLEQRAKQLQIPIIHPDTSSEQ